MSITIILAILALIWTILEIYFMQFMITLYDTKQQQNEIKPTTTRPRLNPLSSVQFIAEDDDTQIGNSTPIIDLINKF